MSTSTGPEYYVSVLSIVDKVRFGSKLLPYNDLIVTLSMSAGELPWMALSNSPICLALLKQKQQQLDVMLHLQLITAYLNAEPQNLHQPLKHDLQIK